MSLLLQLAQLGNKLEFREARQDLLERYVTAAHADQLHPPRAVEEAEQVLRQQGWNDADVTTLSDEISRRLSAAWGDQ